MTTTPILRCRITAHHNIDRPYDGTSSDFARVLAEHEATVKALEATGADIIMEDSRPVNARAKAALATIDGLKHQIEEMEKEREWQPMETSPKDRPIIVRSIYFYAGKLYKHTGWMEIPE